MDLTRSQFLHLLAGTGIGALGLSALGACDKSDGKDPIDGPPGNPDAPKVDAAIDAPPAPANCLQNGTTVNITDLHPHTLLMAITKDDVMAGSEKSYTMDGSGHTHTVKVTQQMFTMLQNNMTVTTQSEPDGTTHLHTVTIRCA